MIAKRLVRLEERLKPVAHDYLRNPRVHHRLTITNIGTQLNLTTATWRRTLSAEGSLFEIVRLDGTRAGLSDADFEKLTESFTVERSGNRPASTPANHQSHRPAQRHERAAGTWSPFAIVRSIAVPISGLRSE